MEKPKYKKEYIRFRITSLDKDGNFLEVYSQDLTCNENLKKHFEVLSRSFIPYIHRIRAKASRITNVLIGFEIQAKYGFDGNLFKDKILKTIITNNIKNDTISDDIESLVKKEELYLYKHALRCLDKGIEILSVPVYQKQVSKDDLYRASLSKGKPHRYIKHSDEKPAKKEVKIYYKK